MPLVSYRNQDALDVANLSTASWPIAAQNQESLFNKSLGYSTPVHEDKQKTSSMETTNWHEEDDVDNMSVMTMETAFQNVSGSRASSPLHKRLSEPRSEARSSFSSSHTSSQPIIQPETLPKDHNSNPLGSFFCYDPTHKRSSMQDGDSLSGDKINISNHSLTSYTLKQDQGTVTTARSRKYSTQTYSDSGTVLSSISKDYRNQQKVESSNNIDGSSKNPLISSFAALHLTGGPLNDGAKSSKTQQLPGKEEIEVLKQAPNEENKHPNTEVKMNRISSDERLSSSTESKGGKSQNQLPSKSFKTKGKTHVYTPAKITLLESEMTRLSLELAESHTILDGARMQIQYYQKQVANLESLIGKLEEERSLLAKKLRDAEKKDIVGRMNSTKSLSSKRISVCSLVLEEDYSDTSDDSSEKALKIPKEVLPKEEKTIKKEFKNEVSTWGDLQVHIDGCSVASNTTKQSEAELLFSKMDRLQAQIDVCSISSNNTKDSKADTFSFKPQEQFSHRSIENSIYSGSTAKTLSTEGLSHYQYSSSTQNSENNHNHLRKDIPSNNKRDSFGNNTEETVMSPSYASSDKSNNSDDERCSNDSVARNEIFDDDPFATFSRKEEEMSHGKDDNNSIASNSIIQDSDTSMKNENNWKSRFQPPKLFRWGR